MRNNGTERAVWVLVSQLSANYITFSPWSSKSVFGPNASHMPHILFCVFPQCPLLEFNAQNSPLSLG